MPLALREPGISPIPIRYFFPFLSRKRVATPVHLMAGLGNEDREFAARDAKLSYRERSRDRNLDLRALRAFPPIVALACRFVLRRAHHEAAFRYHDHFRAAIDTIAKGL